MDPTTAEVSRIVEYRRDRWNMARVPLALLFCLTGLFFVVYVDPKPPGHAILKGFALLLAAAAVVALAVFAFERKSAGSVVAAGFLATALAILALAVLCWIAPADFFPTRRGSKLPANWLGLVADHRRPRLCHLGAVPALHTRKADAAALARGHRVPCGLA